MVTYFPQLYFQWSPATNHVHYEEMIPKEFQQFLRTNTFWEHLNQFYLFHVSQLASTFLFKPWHLSKLLNVDNLHKYRSCWEQILAHWSNFTLLLQFLRRFIFQDNHLKKFIYGQLFLQLKFFSDKHHLSQLSSYHHFKQIFLLIYQMNCQDVL